VPTEEDLIKMLPELIWWTGWQQYHTVL
jgi:hypothetical protein